MEQSLHVTVAAIVERENRFLLVAERVDGRLVVNQPAGHWEPGETLQQAVVRETLEETGWRFSPEALVGVYQWAHPGGRDVFLRFTFCGDAEPAVRAELDSDIQEVLWWSEQDVRSASLPLRSPMVLRCIDDFRNGKRYDLNCIQNLGPAT